MVTFTIDVTEKIRIILTLSTAGGNLTETFFDSALIILSKRLAENTLSSEPWWDAQQGEFEGYLRSMVLRLSHMKWAATPSSANPAWVSSRAGAERWLADFDAFFGPVIGQLRSDYDLAKLMWDAIHYERPAWVLSDAPASAMFFKERFMALQR